MDPIIETLTSYGVLGLWTATLLWNNHQMKKNFQERYDNINEKIIEGIKNNKKTLSELSGLMHENKQILDTGFRMVQDKHQEDRLKSTFRRAITQEDIKKA